MRTSISKIAGRTSNWLLRTIAASGLVSGFIRIPIGLGVLFCLFPSGVYAESLRIVASERVDINRPSGNCDSTERFLTSDVTALCVINGFGGRFEGGGEFGNLERRNNGWFLRANSCQPGVFFVATCYQISQ